jgi:hypothetical protein
LSAPDTRLVTTVEALKALLEEHDRESQLDPDAIISLSTAAAELAGVDTGQRYRATYQRLYKRIRRGRLINRSTDRTLRVRRGDVVR